MPRLKKQGREFFLAFSEQEAGELGLETGKEYDLGRAKQGIWVLSEKQGQEKPVQMEAIDDARIFDLLAKKNLSERVEGKFEKQLNEKELERLKQLLEEGKIIAFRLNEKYKKAVYKIAPEKKKESENANAPEKPIEEYSIDTDGFLVVKNEERAKRLSEELQGQIKGGKIKGMRSFDSHFYIIETALLEKYFGETCAIIKNSKSIILPELSQKLGISRMLARIVCEFLKEDGEIIEKRKEAYQIV